jgi:YHS domain-containing protein
VRGILFLALAVLVLVLVWPLVRQWRGRATSIGPRRDELVKDPVCETYVLQSRAMRRQVDGVTHYFCSPACADRYVQGERRA